jgi:uncharacterized membrane protein YfcA
MIMNESLAFVLLGIVTGILAGIFGVGGGLIMVPALVWIFHFSQHQAQGISLTAMLLPVGILGAFAYYQRNPFPIKPGLWIALGILLGAYLGGMMAQQISGKSLRIGFGVLLIVGALKMIFGK